MGGWSFQTGIRGWLQRETPKGLPPASQSAAHDEVGHAPGNNRLELGGREAAVLSLLPGAVAYTHLTLPTILLV